MIPIVAAVAKKAVGGVVKKAIAKGAVKTAVKEGVKGVVKGAAKKVVSKVPPITAKKSLTKAVESKQKLGMDLVGDSKANTYVGKKSLVGSKLKEISKTLKEKAKKALDNIAEGGGGGGDAPEWEKREPIVMGSEAPQGSGIYDESISKLKSLQ